MSRNSALGIHLFNTDLIARQMYGKYQSDFKLEWESDEAESSKYVEESAGGSDGSRGTGARSLFLGDRRQC